MLLQRRVLFLYISAKFFWLPIYLAPPLSHARNHIKSTPAYSSRDELRRSVPSFRSRLMTCSPRLLSCFCNSLPINPDPPSTKLLAAPISCLKFFLKGN